MITYFVYDAENKIVIFIEYLILKQCKQNCIVKYGRIEMPINKYIFQILVIEELISCTELYNFNFIILRGI